MFVIERKKIFFRISFVQFFRYKLYFPLAVRTNFPFDSFLFSSVHSMRLIHLTTVFAMCNECMKFMLVDTVSHSGGNTHIRTKQEKKYFFVQQSIDGRKSALEALRFHFLYIYMFCEQRINCKLQDCFCLASNFYVRCYLIWLLFNCLLFKKKNMSI